MAPPKERLLRTMAFMKLKAYHNRALQWRAHRDPAVMSRIPTTDRGHVLGKTVDSFYRQAGRDLYDIAFLLSHHTTEAAVRDLAKESGLDADPAPLLARAPEPPLAFFARSMADAEGDAPTVERLDRWGSK